MTNDDAPLMSRRQALKALAAASVCPLLVNCEFVDFDGELVEESSFSLTDPGLEALDEIGARVCFEHGAQDILLIRVSEDEIVAFDQLCPHANLSLAECGGNAQTSQALWDQEQQTLTCPWHQSVFAADGSVVAGPSQSPITTYDVAFNPETGQGTVFSR